MAFSFKLKARQVDTDEITTNDGSQTLSNKTITAPDINGGTADALTSLTTTVDASINSLTVGKGGGNVATNTAVGRNALIVNTTGTENNAHGDASLYSNTTGSYNSAFGTYALINNVTGIKNAAFGGGSLAATLGDYNTGIGYHAGYDLTTGSNNTLLGYNAQPSSATVSNEITLGDTNVTTVRTYGVYDTAKGVKFPATQAPSADANTLDDYEEGTFTPTIVGSTIAGTGTYTQNIGYYTKVGNITFIEIFIIVTNHTGTGDIRISNIPFAHAKSLWTVFSTITDSLSYDADRQLSAILYYTASEIRLYQHKAGAASAGVPMDTTFTLAISGSYST